MNARVVQSEGAGAAAVASAPSVSTLLTGGMLATVARTFSWTGAARLLSTFGNIVRYAVFARMLGPFDFGVAATALVTLDMLTACTDASFGRALVQQDDDAEPYMDTAWVTSFATGLLLALVMVVAARPLADFFRLSNHWMAFVAVTPIAIARACQSPAMWRMYRHLEVHVVLILNVSELAASFIVGVLAILYWRDWRGLVLATLAGQVARSVLTFWYYPYRPRWRFNPGQALRLFQFARWVTGLKIAEFLGSQIDNFAVAHLLGPGALATYQMAFSLGELPGAEFSAAAGLVTFPLTAQLRKEPKLRRRLFAISMAAILIVTVAYTAFIFKWGDLMVTTLLGDKWIGAIAPLRILCFYGMLQGLIGLGASFLDGMGKPAYSFWVSLARSAAMVVLIYPLTASFGTVGAALAGLISVAVAVPVMFKLYAAASAAADGQV